MFEHEMMRVSHASRQGPGKAPASAPIPANECGDECRCHCGSLLARVVQGGVELKCRRCKRTFIVKVATASEDGI